MTPHPKTKMKMHWVSRRFGDDYVSACGVRRPDMFSDDADAITCVQCRRSYDFRIDTGQAGLMWKGRKIPVKTRPTP